MLYLTRLTLHLWSRSWNTWLYKVHALALKLAIHAVVVVEMRAWNQELSVGAQGIGELLADVDDFIAVRVNLHVCISAIPADFPTGRWVVQGARGYEVPGVIITVSRHAGFAFCAVRPCQVLPTCTRLIAQDAGVIMLLPVIVRFHAQGCAVGEHAESVPRQWVSVNVLDFFTILTCITLPLHDLHLLCQIVIIRRHILQCFRGCQIGGQIVFLVDGIIALVTGHLTVLIDVSSVVVVKAIFQLKAILAHGNSNEAQVKEKRLGKHNTSITAF